MKISPTLVPTSLAALVILIFAGCATVNTVSPAYPEAKPHLVPDKRIITNDTLNRIAYVEGVTDSTVSGDLKRVQVMLHNLTSSAKTISYRFQWYDRQGMAIGNPLAQTAFLEGGQVVPIGDTAPSPNAVDWQLTLQESVRRTPGQLP